MDKLIPFIPGLENIMRRRDLPNICRLDPESTHMQYYLDQTSKMGRASALILNTFEELEAPIIYHLHSIFPSIYAIGPLHIVPRPIGPDTSHNSSSLFQMDQSCMGWLDSQRPKSVLYVSFGSVVVLTNDQFTEFWHGLVDSGKPFLWAIRPNLIADDNNGPNITTLDELKAATPVRGLIVGWAPQEDVLAHDAVGGFLTHSGWNSTLECMAAGKPMICWPMITDQQVNSRCVSHMWKVGLDMKDVCERSMVEKMVRDLMEGGREELLRSTEEIARLARESVREGGSSHRNLGKLIEDIKIAEFISNYPTRERWDDRRLAALGGAALRGLKMFMTYVAVVAIMATDFVFLLAAAGGHAAGSFVAGLYEYHIELAVGSMGYNGGYFRL
ncbi:UDP-glycosyltransferase 1 [Striga asiatica]|uniref:UDP-glycosyltransferase 1 n=1 Tax=Striga asiatica TaxID=4170 RepID=A0A5A7R2Z5_STRAF|nr:UDP-glycosyltransferase 1 [Striga asiatica]